ncbi:MAG TPA: aspartyl-phosphate phosphatase Spo0E family protein [Bacilli bacterium]
MTADLKKMMKQIEELRSELHSISQEKEFTDPEVITASKILDTALNDYNRLLKRLTGKNKT